MGLPLNKVRIAGQMNLDLSSRTCWVQCSDFLLSAVPREGVLVLACPGISHTREGEKEAPSGTQGKQGRTGNGVGPSPLERSQTLCCFSPLHESQFSMSFLSIPLSHLISHQSGALSVAGESRRE